MLENNAVNSLSADERIVFQPELILKAMRESLEKLESWKGNIIRGEFKKTGDVQNLASLRKKMQEFSTTILNLSSMFLSYAKQQDLEIPAKYIELLTTFLSSEDIKLGWEDRIKAFKTMSAGIRELVDVNSDGQAFFSEKIKGLDALCKRQKGNDIAGHKAEEDFLIPIVKNQMQLFAAVYSGLEEQHKGLPTLILKTYSQLLELMTLQFAIYPFASARPFAPAVKKFSESVMAPLCDALKKGIEYIGYYGEEQQKENAELGPVKLVGLFKEIAKYGVDESISGDIIINTANILHAVAPEELNQLATNISQQLSDDELRVLVAFKSDVALKNLDDLSQRELANFIDVLTARVNSMHTKSKLPAANLGDDATRSCNWVLQNATAIIAVPTFAIAMYARPYETTIFAAGVAVSALYQNIAAVTEQCKLVGEYMCTKMGFAAKIQNQQAEPQGLVRG